MEINRDNYEEYFLMYVDNELTDAEKVAVLMFLKQNKDLEDEFRMMHHTVARPEENVHLEDKSFLLRTDLAPFISEKNYEEVFVLYHDNELTGHERLLTESFLADHQGLKNEFELIGLARFTAESAFVFPHKKLLYEREKAGRIIPVVFWRMLAAAVFIGFGLWISGILFRHHGQIINSQVNAFPARPTAPKVEKNSQVKEKQDQTIVHSSVAGKKEVLATTRKAKQKKWNGPDLRADISKPGVKDSLTKKVPMENSADPLLSKTNGGFTSPGKNEIEPMPAQELTALTAIQPLKTVPKTPGQDNEGQASPDYFAKTASYVSTQYDQNYVFYDVTTSDFRKTKVGGFLKKIKRVIARTNPIGRLISGDDRQLASK